MQFQQRGHSVQKIVSNRSLFQNVKFSGILKARVLIHGSTFARDENGVYICRGSIDNTHEGNSIHLKLSFHERCVQMQRVDQNIRR